jgi:hypothetical protein
MTGEAQTGISTACATIRLSAQLIPELCFGATRLALRKKCSLTDVKVRWP